MVQKAVNDAFMLKKMEFEIFVDNWPVYVAAIILVFIALYTSSKMYK